MRGSGEVPRAFPLFWVLTMDAKKLEQVLFTLEFYSTWKSHVKHSCWITRCCLLDLGHFLKLYPWVLFFVLLQSLRELFLCSSGKTSFHDNSQGLSIHFFTHSQAFFIPKPPSWWSSPSSQQCLLSNHFICTNYFRSQAFTHYIRREWCLKFLVKQQTSAKKNQTSWKMTSGAEDMDSTVCTSTGGKNYLKVFHKLDARQLEERRGGTLAVPTTLEFCLTFF